MKIVSSALIAMLVCIASLSCSAYADDTVPIFKGQDLTREKLLDVLAPELERGVSKNPAPGSGQTPSARRIGLLITFVVSSAKLDGQAKASLDILADVLQTERLRNNTL